MTINGTRGNPRVLLYRKVLLYKWSVGNENQVLPECKLPSGERPHGDDCSTRDYSQVQHTLHPFIARLCYSHAGARAPYPPQSGRMTVALEGTRRMWKGHARRTRFCMTWAALLIARRSLLTHLQRHPPRQQSSDMPPGHGPSSRATVQNALPLRQKPHRPPAGLRRRAVSPDNNLRTIGSLPKTRTT